jgi:hypothetical protein
MDRPSRRAPDRQFPFCNFFACSLAGKRRRQESVTVVGSNLPSKSIDAGPAKQGEVVEQSKAATDSLGSNNAELDSSDDDPLMSGIKSLGRQISDFQNSLTEYEASNSRCHAKIRYRFCENSLADEKFRFYYYY